MENKGDKDFYYSLRKKELQNLCKRYGLSPYMTKSNLVNSLYSYLKKKSLSSSSNVESSSVCHTSLRPPLRCTEFDSTMHASEDTSCLGEKNWEIHSSTAKIHEEGSSIVAEAYNKASGFNNLECPLNNVPETSGLNCKRRETLYSQNELGHSENDFDCRVQSPKLASGKNKFSCASEKGAGDATQIESRTLNHGAFQAENGSTFSGNSSVAIRSFEFYVSAEEGINLIVDLNSSPSDWPKRLESQVFGCPNAHVNKIGSLREELEILGTSGNGMNNSNIWNTEGEHEISNGHAGAGCSSISTKGECDPIMFSNTCGTDGSLKSSSMKPQNIASESSVQFEEEQDLLLFCRPDSDVQNLIPSGTESCQIDMEPDPLKSSGINAPQIETLCNSNVNSTQEAPKSLNSLEHQNSDFGDKICEDMALKKTCADLSPGLLHPGSSSSGSMELQLSEVVSQEKDAANSHFRYSSFLDVADPNSNSEIRDDGIAHSSTCTETQENLSACIDEWEGSKLLDGAETSESSHLKETPKDLADGEVLKRKREKSDGEDLICCCKFDSRILRNRQHLSGRVLPRRSMRLFSKV